MLFAVDLFCKLHVIYAFKILKCSYSIYTLAHSISYKRSIINELRVIDRYSMNIILAINYNLIVQISKRFADTVLVTEKCTI